MLKNHNKLLERSSLDLVCDRRKRLVKAVFFSKQMSI